jgi:hypothetical protein
MLAGLLPWAAVATVRVPRSWRGADRVTCRSLPAVIGDVLAREGTIDLLKIPYTRPERRAPAPSVRL